MKKLSEYHRAKGMRDGHRSECRSCMAQKAKERYERDPEAVKARVRAWQLANPEKYAAQQARWRDSGRKATAGRRSHLKQTFGLTEDQYLTMLERQGGVCAICGAAPKAGANLDVDHSHSTGEVRGLLCRQCNHALGLLDDDLMRLFQAVEYLSGAVVARELTYLPEPGQP